MPLQTRMDEDEIISGINVTPLVDVAFVVLIIFIVTASIVLKDNIPVNLPKAQSAQESSGGLLNIALTSQGQVYINGNPGSLDELPRAVAQARARVKSQGGRLSAFISSDVKAEYGLFAQVVDRLRMEGLTEIALDTQPVDLEKVLE